MGIFKKSKIHHIVDKKSKKEYIKENCQKMRNQISLNLYYIKRAQEKLSGSKLVYVINKLKNDNDNLYTNINILKCQGRDDILLTMEPKLY